MPTKFEEVVEALSEYHVLLINSRAAGAPDEVLCEMAERITKCMWLASVMTAAAQPRLKSAGSASGQAYAARERAFEH